MKFPGLHALIKKQLQ